MLLVAFTKWVPMSCELLTVHMLANRGTAQFATGLWVSLVCVLQRSWGDLGCPPGAFSDSPPRVPDLF